MFEYNRILYSHDNEQTITINNDSLKINIKRMKPDTNEYMLMVPFKTKAKGICDVRGQKNSYL